MSKVSASGLPVPTRFLYTGVCARGMCDAWQKNRRKKHLPLMKLEPTQPSPSEQVLWPHTHARTHTHKHSLSNPCSALLSQTLLVNQFVHWFCVLIPSHSLQSSVKALHLLSFNLQLILLPLNHKKGSIATTQQDTKHSLVHSPTDHHHLNNSYAPLQETFKGLKWNQSEVCWLAQRLIHQ